MEKISSRVMIKEAVYDENLGVVEMFYFMDVATIKEKKLMERFLNTRHFRKAWELLKKVTGVNLVDQADIVDY